MAQVNSQPEGKPMVIETPVANAEVLGTRLSLFASSVLTELVVLEGEVRFRRPSDGQSIDVRSGERVVASADSDLIPQPLSPVSSVWEEDFENGLPRYWIAGQLIHESLPSGSFGAVRAVPSRGMQGDPDGPFRITTMREWTRGLFRIEADTHLNFTYRLRSPAGSSSLEYEHQPVRSEYRRYLRVPKPGPGQIPPQSVANCERAIGPLPPHHSKSQDERVRPVARGRRVGRHDRFRIPDEGPGTRHRPHLVTRGTPGSVDVLKESQ